MRVLLVAPGGDPQDATRVAHLAWALSVLGHTASAVYTAEQGPAAVVQEALLQEAGLVLVLHGACLPEPTRNALRAAGVTVALWRATDAEVPAGAYRYVFPAPGAAAGSAAGADADLVDQVRAAMAEVQAGAAGATAAGKPEGYYDHLHTTLLNLVPPGVRRVLDVGCAAGRLGAALRARGAEEVVGVEIVPEVAARAAASLDRVLVGDVERMELPFPAGYFDCIVYGDVLEHLRDPWTLLRRHVPLLAADGCVVASIPNVNHLSVVAGLLAGAWPYQPAGILDRTHMRFFTLREIVELFEGAGLVIAELAANTTPELAPVARRVQEALAPLGLVSPTFEKESVIVQYVMRCTRPRT